MVLNYAVFFTELKLGYVSLVLRINTSQCDMTEFSVPSYVIPLNEALTFIDPKEIQRCTPKQWGKCGSVLITISLQVFLPNLDMGNGGYYV
jgi:hypothetical protein